MITALALLATIGAADPRIPLIELQLQGEPEAALERLERTLAADPAAGHLGLDYLRGHLLEELDRYSEAHRAFARAMATHPDLEQYSRFRLAVNQTRSGHPELAAGLLAKLLADDPPSPLVAPAAELLVELIDAGGDCALLADLDDVRLPQPERRQLTLAAADCARRRGEGDRAAELLLEIVRGGTRDEAARAAAERLHELYPQRAREPVAALLVGQTFHHHRQFELAIRYLTLGIGDGLRGGDPASAEVADALYSLARSHFWREEYLLAGSLFGQLAARLPDPRERARPLYQQARCYELHGSWDLAANGYRLAYTVDPRGEWAGLALMSALRLEWRLGSDATALELYEVLASDRRWSGLASRAGLFLASSDLVRRRTDRAAAWLDAAARWRNVSRVEIDFWRGRLAELEGRRVDAVRHLVDAITRSPYHPLAREAARRLASPALIDTAASTGRSLAGSESGRSQLAAWLLLGDADTDGRRARSQLERRLRADRRTRAFLDIAAPPPAEWPLWSSPLNQPEEQLLALGVWNLGSPAMLKHFPVADVSLGFTASRLLARASENRRSLYVAEILQRRVPSSLPPGLLPLELRKLLFPLPYRELIAGAAERHAVDPALLAAIIREESRFDPTAISPASARGLTQFVLPTARRLAGRLGLESVEARDLHQPATSIALGAAYLAELADRFDGQLPAMVAAYNAGEKQAELWTSYCYSRDPAEYLTKVTFSETRRYLLEVLSSRAQYEEIWGDRG